MSKYGYREKVKYAKSVGVYLAGGAVGVLAEKVVNDAISAGQLPNPQWLTVTLSDVAMVTAELGTAYYLRKKKPSKRKKLVSNLLVGMATGTVAAQAYEWGAQQGSWFALTRGARLGSSMSTPYGNGIGRYGRNGGATTALGYRGTSYPRR